MNISDPANERQRLADYYAALTEGELQKIASDAASLTDVAREALRQELASRNLEIEPGHFAVPSQESESQDLVTVDKFRDLPAALLAKGSLESAGIECFLGDENIVRMDWFISNLIGGIKLKVRPADAEAAREILSEPIPESFDVEGIGKYVQPHCPNCQSLEIVFEGIHQGMGYASAGVLGIPIRIEKQSWKCQSCGYEWRGSETEEHDEAGSEDL